MPLSALAVNLDTYRWRNRLLFLIAPQVTEPAVRQVLHSLESRSDELVDRDMFVLQLYQRGQSLVGDRPITEAQSEQLRVELGVEPDEKMLVLVGKDGRVKRRAPLTTDVREILQQIDAMPVRRDEMQKKNYTVWQRVAPVQPALLK